MSPRLLLALMLMLGLLAWIQPASAGGPTLRKELIHGEWRAPGAPSLPHPASTLAATERPGDFEPWLRFVYAEFGEDKWEIWQAEPFVTQNTRGHERRPIVRNLGNNISPRLSPDLNQILFASDQAGNFDLYRVPYAGGTTQPIFASPSDDFQPVWSPDGNRLAFATERDGNAELYAVNLDGGSLARLTVSPGPDVSPSWSPDGRTIIWVRVTGTQGVVWAMDANGLNQRALTGALRFLGNPVWSPDGSQIALDYDANQDGYNRPAVMAADGSGLRELETLLDFEGYTHDVTVNGWSPEGERVMSDVARYRVTSAGPQLASLYLARFGLGGGGQDPIFGVSDLIMQADGRSTDRDAPVSSFEPLTGYRRAGLFGVRWSGADRGVAGLRDIEFQTRINGGSWSILQAARLENPSPSERSSAAITGAPGDQVELRSRAKDDAGNVEVFPSIPEADITFFSTAVAGRVLDNRGGPALASITFTGGLVGDATLDSAGRYLARLASRSERSVSVTAEGFQSPPATLLGSSGDELFDATLLPSDDLLRDGGFEADGLGGWSPSGNLAVARVVGQAFTGSAAVQLGQACAEPCLSATERVADANGGIINSLMAIAPSAEAHFIYSRSFSGNVLYRSRSAAGIWSEPEVVIADNVSQPFPAAIAITDDGVVHTISGLSTGTMSYRARSPEGVWAAPADLGGVRGSVSLFVTPKSLILIYECFSQLNCPGDAKSFVRVFTPEAGWGSARPLTGAFHNGSIAPDGQLYLVEQTDSDGINLLILDPHGSVVGQQHIADDDLNSTNPPDVVVDARGTLHLFWGSSGGNGKYAVCLADLDCGPAQSMPSLNGSIDVTSDAQGVIHVLSGVGSAESFPVYYRRVLPEGAITDPVKLSDSFYAMGQLGLDASGRLHVLIEERYIRTLDGSPGEATISRSVSIPSAMHKPTLSFAYSLGRLAPGSRLELRADTGAGSELVLSKAVPTPWGLVWADMAPYAGKTVTITLALVQAPGTPSAELFVDDLALGSWQTPVISAVSTRAIRATEATSLTITGANFIGGARVLLGEHELANVEQINEDTLRVQALAGIRPGLYRLMVINPGGQRAAIDGLVVGERIALPLLAR